MTSDTGRPESTFVSLGTTMVRRGSSPPLLGGPSGTPGLTLAGGSGRSSPVSGHGDHPLSVWYLVAINSCVAGLEIAVCVAFTFIPTLLLKSGFSETQMSIVLGIAPLIAMLTVSRLGRWSDNCTSRLGRRRPFLLGMSAVLVFSLGLLYFGQAISSELPTVKVGVLAVGVILLDYSSQAAINPCEALVSDIIAERSGEKYDGEEFGFTVYSGMLSVGSCIGYLIIALDWKSLGISLGNTEQTNVVLCLLLYIVCFMITMLSANETPFRPREDQDHIPLLRETGSDPGYVSEEDDFRSSILRTSDKPPVKDSVIRLPLFHRRNLPSLWSFFSLRRCNPVKFLGAIFRALKQIICLPLMYLNTVYSAPKVLRNLYLADLLSWTGIMAHAMFYTDFAAVVVYGGKPDAPPGSVYDILFDEGVRMGSWGLLLHSITAAVYAVFIQEHITNLLGLKGSYKLGLAVHAASMAVTVLFSSSLTCINLAAAASGVGYAVVTTIPNTLVTMYHEDAILYYGTTTWGGVGEAIAILDSGYFLSQICLSLVMGHVVELTGLPHYYIIVSCLAGVAAIILTDSVVFNQRDLKKIGPIEPGKLCSDQ